MIRKCHGGQLSPTKLGYRVKIVSIYKYDIYCPRIEHLERGNKWCGPIIEII